MVNGKPYRCWQDGEKEADADVKEGRIKTFSSVEELIKDLDEE